MTALDLRSPTVDIFDEPGDDLAVVLTLLDDNGAPFDASGYTLEAVVTADVETPPTFSVVVSGAGDNIVTLTMSDADETLSGDYTLTATLGGSTTTWLSGSLVLIPGGRGSGNGTQEVTVNIGTTLTATVVLGAAQGGGGGGGSAVWGDITGDIADQTDLQAELDGKQDAGAAAGGVLAGTYPNPSFAADMATQAELNAVAAAAVNDGDTAGGDLTGTYPNPTFAVNMATQAELDAVSAVANAAQPAGAAAGGVLSGTYPNPGFAADMATQAELNAVAAAAVNDGDAAGGVLSGTYPNPGFAADMATQAELDAGLALKAPLASPTFTGTVTLPTGLTGVLRADSGVVGTDSNVTDLVSAASDTAAGIVELAIASELNTGTDTTRAVTPDALAGSNFGVKEIAVEVFAAATVWTTGDGKRYFRIPPSLNGMNLVGVGVGANVTSSSGIPTLQIARGRQSSATSAHSYVDMLSTLLTIDVADYDSKDAGTPAVINASNDDVATGDLIRVDCDVAGTSTAGGHLTLLFQLP